MSASLQDALAQCNFSSLCGLQDSILSAARRVNCSNYAAMCVNAAELLIRTTLSCLQTPVRAASRLQISATQVKIQLLAGICHCCRGMLKRMLALQWEHGGMIPGSGCLLKQALLEPSRSSGGALRLLGPNVCCTPASQ